MNLMINSPCMRCGQFHLRGQCRAVNEQCFNCSRSGHFKAVCEFKGNVLKSARSKQRDAERMKTFIAKKTAEMLPFWNISGDELSSFFPKNTGISEHFQMKLKKAENAVLHLTAECSDARLNYQIKQQDAQNLLSREQRRRHDAEQKVHRVELQIERMEERLTSSDQQKIDFENKNSELVGKIMEQKSEIEQLEFKVHTSDNRIRTMELYIKDLKFQRNEIFYFNSKALGLLTEFRKHHNAVKQELVEALNKLYKMTATSFRGRRNFECDRCGSSCFHEHSNCISRGNTCAVCGKSNHLAAVCRERLEPITADASVLKLLDMLAITLPPRN